MDTFLDLFKLAWRKNKTVKAELHNQNWIRGLWRMQTVTKMANFVKLWDLVQDIQMIAEPDIITWRWIPNGKYTMMLSVYTAQFLGSYRRFNGKHIWQAQYDGKAKFFA